MEALKYASILCCTLAGAFNAQESFAQGVIFNGGFESPTIAPNSNLDVDPNGWSRIGLFTITHLFNGNGGISEVPIAHGGYQHFLLGDAGTGISQNVTIYESNLFRLDWWTATDVASSDVPLTYNVRVWNNSNSSLITSNQFVAQLGIIWTSNSMELSLQAGSYLLEFQTTGNYKGGSIFLDDVSMVPIPEPGTFALFGFAAMAFVTVRFCGKPRVDASLAKRLGFNHGT